MIREDGYRSYFTSVTDEKVEKIVDALKAEDEFDNKIFIVVRTMARRRCRGP